ncbi:LNS2 domain-containing protein [Aliiglaciecola lipolytica]|uniref:LNS2/PITP domain-containing protein n=1 Tax=Aliiglaciecola lipolytica E3 TaxID=1127673 RepID=K6XZ16_9ALTE|nr:hypothetical protein [Aliiglaciecola lipolytica]GAC16881.1 hypothetical protein GLIP_4270 [Aliiglaciecola lipolytica E3]
MQKVILGLMLILNVSCSLDPTPVDKATKDAKHAVVFDIDGTLTPNNLSIYTARCDAAQVVSQYAGRGYKIIYLSARNRYFQFNIPAFLRDNGFPKGSIHVPQSGADRDDFAAFKLSILKRYVNNGWKLSAAYGDSTTDFNAYIDAGINKNNIYGLKRAGEKHCETGQWTRCLDSWSTLLNSRVLQKRLKTNVSKIEDCNTPQY